MSHPHAQVRLSLQTKLLFVITLIMALALLANSALEYYRAVQLNEAASQRRIDSLNSTFEKLIGRSTGLFEQQLDQIQVDDHLRNRSTPPPRVLSTNPAIEEISILDIQGKPLRQWQATPDAPGTAMPLHDSIVRQVREKQQPVSRILCQRSCYQVSYVPVISRQGAIHIVSGVRNLQELFVDFALLTDADAALIPTEQSQTRPAVASNADAVVPLLNELQRQTGFLQKSVAVYASTSAGLYAASSSTLGAPYAASPMSLVILADDTSSQQRIRDSLKVSLIGSGIALLVTMLLTYLALRTTLKKLINLSNTLPMLSESSYDQLRDSLFKYTRKPGYVDEIDQLNFTVLEVADALEEMETSVAEHRQRLVHKMAEHREAQEFNDVLVNDSPLVIAAHHLTGELRLLNSYGRELAGWQPDVVEKRRIEDLILPDLSGRSIDENLKPLREGKQNRIQTEQLIKSTSGNVSDLMWIHALVRSGGEPFVLSVGLDITERRRTESRLRWLSKHDNVTDLLNREAFHEEASLLIQQYGDSHRVELLLLDVDKFSAINDMYGFQNGDAVLRETARFIERLISCDTIIARSGANEFSALLLIDQEDFAKQGHPLKGRAPHFFTVLETETIEITLTGVLAVLPHDGDTIDELIGNATAALRTLKPIDHGKINQISESVDNRALRQEKMQVQDSVVKALSDERFELMYQPIYDLKSERISHCECLVRMRSEEGHLVSPAAFLDVAKESGLMAKLDLMVLKMALKQLSAWDREGVNLKLSVNITAATFESDLFIRELKSLLLETGARPSQLIFEIVETEAIHNLDTARELCERLADLNVQIAFDDFGIGFTSFEYLRDLPVDYIKIDQSFIRYLYKRKSDQLLVKSMVDMALALGKKVVAEGVEDDGSADLLRGMGVHYLQGYFISRPRRIDELDLSFKMGIH